MRDPLDVPHCYAPLDPDQTKCGLPMAGMKAVTDLQVLVFLSGRHCGTCTPALGRVDAAHHIGQRRAA